MSWIRHPKTANERRANAPRELGQLVRAKRKPINLPDAWDDKFRERQRSWKCHRTSQYKPQLNPV